MRRADPFSFLALLLLTITFKTFAQTGASTINAASCQEAAVNAVINGPTHTAVNGDVIVIPAGTCTWSSQLVGPSGVNFTLMGTGSPNSGASATGANASCANGTTGTRIIDNYASSYMIAMHPSYNASFNAPASRVSCMAIDPYSTSTALWDPILLTGTCTSSGCPAIRVDNVTFGLSTPWSVNNNSSNAEAGILAVNVFGVLDHNSIGSSSLPAAAPAGMELFNSEMGAYLGSGSYGDNSWRQPDSFGGANNLFAENNLVYNAGTLALNDSEQSDTYSNRGGARAVLRYNTLHQGSGNSGGYGVFQNHGTDSGGRARGAREAEVYNNTFYCDGSTQNCSGVDGGLRSGTAMFFGNRATFTVGSNGYWISLALYRNDTSTFNPFSPNCGGFSPWDVNDSGSVSSTYTVSSTGSGVVNVSGTPWASGQFAPSAGNNAYILYDITATPSNPTYAAITNNTSGQLSISGLKGTISNGDSFVIVGSHLYYAGTITTASGGSGTAAITMADTTANFGSSNSLIPSGAPYSVFDATASGGSWGGEVASNSSTAITVQPYVGYGPYGFANGDTYWVTRSTACVDQPARGQQTSTVLSGDPISPVGAVTESVAPVYQWNEVATGGSTAGNIGPSSLRLIPYRDFYAQASGVQTSSSSPFSCNGSTGGTGWGTTADRPSSCSNACSANTLGCGYFATDANSGNGELYVWSSGAWVSHYQPYAYPHPLDGGTPVASGNPPAPPTGLTGTVK